MRILIFFLLTLLPNGKVIPQTIAPLIPPHNNVLKKVQSQKISPFLIDLIYEMKNNPQFIDRYKNSSSDIRKFLHYKMDSENRIFVKLKCSADYEAVLDELKAKRIKIVAANSTLKVIDCWLDGDRILSLIQNPDVRNISECMRGYTRTGSVTSEGDTLHKTDVIRQYLGADGSGIKVGVISDGVDNIASSQSSGDLPSVVNVIDNSQGGDEGTAMLEIIHDLAPGAELYFSEGVQVSEEFINSVNDLVAAGCSVIVDDIGYFGEPYFEEGPIATAVRNVIENNNVVYSSSAGNSQDQHYEGDYNRIVPSPAIAGISEAHNFGGGDYGQSITLTSQQTFYIFLQWNEPFGNSISNYTLNLVTQDMTTRYDVSAIRPDANDPFVYIAAIGGPLTFNLVVEKISGDDRRIELTYNLIGSVNEFNDIPGSINGQPVVEQVLAAGAVRYNSPSLIEYFSSIGPCRIYSYPSYNYVERNKPDVVAVDGNIITGAGGFGQEYPPGSGQIRFFGTSAAAPHVAACAAALWSAYPNLNNSDVRQRLLNGALDLGDPGFDNYYGNGRVDIKASSASPQFTVAGINGGNNSKINNSISPGDAFAETAGYTFTADQAPYLVYLDSLKFQISGSADANDINSFSLYADLDKNNIITQNDSLLGQLPFAVDLQFSNLGFSFDNNSEDIILTADVSSTANPNHSLNVNLNNPTDVVAYFKVNPFSSNFSFGANDITLPVELLTFDVQLINNKAEIKWSTASELNTAYFEISKTVKGIEKIIAKVDAAGSSSVQRSYFYCDNEIDIGEETVYKLYSNETNGFREKIAQKSIETANVEKFELMPNYPNPFNSSTNFIFSIARASYVILKIFDPSGKTVATLVDENLEAGKYEILYDASILSSGMYFIRLNANEINGKQHFSTKRFLFLK
jgi:hypothetical protein